MVDPNNAYSAVTYLIPGGSLMPWDTPTSFSSTIVHLQLLRHQAAIAELLRHFWACFPVVSTQLEDKVRHVFVFKTILRSIDYSQGCLHSAILAVILPRYSTSQKTVSHHRLLFLQ